MAVMRADLVVHNSVATCCNIWREYGAQIYKAWALEIGAVSAQSHALRAPSKCLTQRWGSSHESQVFLVRPPHGRVMSVLTKVLEATSNKRRRKIEDKPYDVHDLDEDKAQARDEYTPKFGRWSVDVLACLREPRWWAVMRISARARSPWYRFQ